MKKLWLTGVLLLSLTAVGCAQQDENIPPISQAEPAQTIQLVETDFYTIELPEEWRAEILIFAQDVPSGDMKWYDANEEMIGGAEIIMAVNDSLADIPDQIKVTHEEKKNNMIIGKIEVVGNALGGDTSIEYHVLIPLEEDQDMHEYVDIHLDGAQYDLEQLKVIAESLVIRNQQFLGYIEGLNNGHILVHPVELVDISEQDRIVEMGLDAADFVNGIAVVKTHEEAKSWDISDAVSYYLVDRDSNMFIQVDRAVFEDYQQKHRDGLFDVTIQDGKVISIEERLM